MNGHGANGSLPRLREKGMGRGLVIPARNSFHHSLNEQSKGGGGVLPGGLVPRVDVGKTHGIEKGSV
jgi:hypothetical protein